MAAIFNSFSSFRANARLHDENARLLGRKKNGEVELFVSAKGPSLKDRLSGRYAQQKALGRKAFLDASTREIKRVFGSRAPNLSDQAKREGAMSILAPVLNKTSSAIRMRDVKVVSGDLRKKDELLAKTQDVKSFFDLKSASKAYMLLVIGSALQSCMDGQISLKELNGSILNSCLDIGVNVEARTDLTPGAKKAIMVELAMLGDDETAEYLKLCCSSLFGKKSKGIKKSLLDPSFAKTLASQIRESATLLTAKGETRISVQSGGRAQNIMLPNFQIGDKTYVPASLLGEGGFGAVYKYVNADDADDAIAIKSLLMEHLKRNDPEGRRMQQKLADEAILHAQIATKDDNESFVEILGARREQGNVYIAMELATGDASDYVDGIGSQDVAQRMEKGIPLLRELAQALISLDQEFVHCDLKWENVFMVGGSPKLGDFGGALCDGASLRMNEEIQNPRQWAPDTLARYKAYKDELRKAQLDKKEKIKDLKKFIAVDVESEVEQDTVPTSGRAIWKSGSRYLKLGMKQLMDELDRARDCDLSGDLRANYNAYIDRCLVKLAEASSDSDPICKKAREFLELASACRRDATSILNKDLDKSRNISVSGACDVWSFGMMAARVFGAGGDKLNKNDFNSDVERLLINFLNGQSDAVGTDETALFSSTGDEDLDAFLNAVLKGASKERPSPEKLLKMLDALERKGGATSGQDTFKGKQPEHMILV